jgi:hypothetical protein
MTRLATLFWLIMVSATGFAMFAVKYQVQALADELAQTAKRAANTEHEIRALDAEWAYLNRPEALGQMNQRYLSLVPIATKQLRTSLADIPMRPVPPPPPAAPPVEAVAANGAAAAMAAPAPAQSAPIANLSAPSAWRPSAASVTTAALETRAAPPEASAPAPVKQVARPSAPHRPKSLDELIAQIAENR